MKGEGLKRFIMNTLTVLMRLPGVMTLLLHLLDGWRVIRDRRRNLSFPYIRLRRGREYQVLIYHRINDMDNPFSDSISTRAFAGHMEVLSRHFKVLPLGELAERAASGDVPPRAVAVTFDDGYRDNYTNAFPVLRELGLPATIFLATGALDSNAPLWHDRVFDAFRTTAQESVIVDGVRYSLAGVQDRLAAMDKVIRVLKASPPEARNELIGELVRRLGVNYSVSRENEMVTWEEVSEMSKHGVTFGAHTVTHPILTRVPLLRAVDEIVSSKNAIEERLGCPVNLFAYPNGSRDDFNPAIKSALRDASFLCAVTTIWGINGSETDPFELRRLWVWDQDPHAAALKLGWYRFHPYRV